MRIAPGLPFLRPPPKHNLQLDRTLNNNMDEKHDNLDSGTDSPPSQEMMTSTHIKPQARKEHDPSVTFEEYHYYALKTREDQKTIEAPKLNWREMLLRKKNTHADGNNNDHSVRTFSDDKLAHHANRMSISDEEWTNASRAFRTASTGACK